MFRTLFTSSLVLIVLGWSGLALADLCAKCKGMSFIQSIGECTSCGGTTSSGAFKLCKKCSAKKGRCEHCLARLGTAKPALTLADSGRTVKIATGTSIGIRLKGNPTTGYSWRTAKLKGDAVKQEGKPVYQSRRHRPGMVGVGGAFTFTFKAVKPGAATIALEYVRPWEKGKKPERVFVVTIEVADK